MYLVLQMKKHVQGCYVSCQKSLDMSQIELLHFPVKLIFFISVHGRTPLFFHTVHSFHQPITSALPAKCVENLTTCSHPHCYHPTPSHPSPRTCILNCLLTASLLLPLPPPIIYFKCGNQSDIFRHKSCPVTPHLNHVLSLLTWKPSSICPSHLE